MTGPVRGRPKTAGRSNRRGAIRNPRASDIQNWAVNWLKNRTVRRRWRQLAFVEWLILIVAIVVGSAFLLLLGFQIPWLALLIAVVGLLLIYRELGESVRE